MAQSTNCRHCDGTGIVWWDACDSRGEHVTREEKCPACLVEAQKTHMGLRHLVTQNPTDILALVPKLAVCGASGSSFTTALQCVDCVECLYEIAWIAIDRARKLGGE